MYSPGYNGRAVPGVRPIPVDGCSHARRLGQEPCLSPTGIADPRLRLPSIRVPPGNICYSRMAGTYRKVRQVPQSGHSCPGHSLWGKLDYNPYLSVEKSLLALKVAAILGDSTYAK